MKGGKVTVERLWRRGEKDGGWREMKNSGVSFVSLFFSYIHRLKTDNRSL